jgi:hypothetical protein
VADAVALAAEAGRRGTPASRVGVTAPV